MTEHMMQAMAHYKLQVDEAVAFLNEKTPVRPEIALILGTGLGGLAERLEDAVFLPYETIPHFPRSTVTSHAGNLIVGRLAGKKVAALQGRFHYYEGYSTRQLTLPVRVLSLLGAKILIASNAAGGLNPGFAPGTLMVLRDHLNFIPENPLRGPNIDEWGPRFPDFSKTYDQEFAEAMLACARKLAVPDVTAGVYAAIPGPSLETPAETRHLRSCGADAVGMSTVPEVIVAKHAGMRILGVSVLSNVNDPDDFKPIILEEIIEQTKKAEARFQSLLLEFLRKI